MSSSPAIIRSVVDLPQPEGPTSTMNSRSLICEVEVVHGLEAAFVNLANVLELTVAMGAALY